MKGKFAHISDCHIGAWREPILRELNDRAFGEAIDISVKNQVDFVIISGDIFDVGIPEMSSVRSAVRKLKQLVDNDIPVYVVYGSHDYSPTTVSVVDVLTSAGLFSNVGEFVQIDEEKEKTKRLGLKPIVDEKTKVLIAGLPARKGGLEKSFYAELKGGTNLSITAGIYSIFVFHASVNELQSLNIPVEQNVSIEDLPTGFSYYAGGHLHKRTSGKLGESPVVYPGPLFGTRYSDLELSARGEKRGFAMVEFEDDKTTKLSFVDLEAPRMLAKTFSAEGRSSEYLNNEIKNFVSHDTLDVKNAIVLLKARGVLTSGKPSDIDWFSYKTLLLERGASVVTINKMGLLTKEAKRIELLGASTKEEIESKLLSEHISRFKPPSKDLDPLSSLEGVRKATKLLGALKTEKREEETKPTFEKRVWKEGSEILDLGNV